LTQHLGRHLAVTSLSRGEFLGHNPPMTRVSAMLRSGLFGLAYVLGYVALDALSYVQPLLKLGITPWNPDAGLTVAFLLLRGWRQTPWAAVAALSAEIWVRGAPAPWLALICASTIIGAGYGGLALALAHRRLDHLLASRRAALEFSAGAALTALTVSAGYAATLVAAGVLPASSAVDAIERNWVGDLNGILTLTPLLLATPFALQALPALRKRGLLIASQGACLALLMVLLFGVRPMGDLPLAYVLFAPVIWITLTWGVIGASAATLFIQISLLAIAAPHLSGSSLVEIQYLLVTLALTALLLGAVLAERRSVGDEPRRPDHLGKSCRAASLRRCRRRTRRGESGSVASGSRFAGPAGAPAAERPPCRWRHILRRNCLCAARSAGARRLLVDRTGYDRP
jgi:two-component system sensor kinase FixL